MITERKVLTLGNSFTDSLATFLPRLASHEHCDLLFKRANFGGCELRRHWAYICAEEADATCRIYCGGRKLRDVLADEKWDFVTMQQASHESWVPETFEPYGSNIAAYMRKFAPDAELCVQQTWAYRIDDPRIMPGGDWRIDQTEMYQRLTKNYCDLAKRIGNCRIIPTGKAVQLARANEKFPFQNYDHELLNTLRWPDLPMQSGDVVGRCFWRKNKDGEFEIGRDSIHLNVRGEYMQACLWFAFLFERKATDIHYIPEEIGKTDAVFLREMAQQALEAKF